MKKDIHPKYHNDAQIICSCSNVIKTGSTVKEMKVEICSACHPFYTGKKKLMDTTGRVDRFKKLTEKTAQKKAAAKKAKTELKAAKPARNATHSVAGGETAAKKPARKARSVRPGKK